LNDERKERDVSTSRPLSRTPRLLAFLAIVEVVTIVACGRSVPKEERTHADALDRSSASPGDVLSRTAPSFRSEILPVLQRQCADPKGCHGDEPTDSVELDLRPTGAFEQLVDVPAKGRPNSWRVRRGEPTTSFLLDKLKGPLRSGEGKMMPLDPNTGVPVQPCPLPAGFIDKVLRPWIAAGAPNN
jgi:hypothetical protein